MWRDKHGDSWSTEERILKGGGKSVPPSIPLGFDYVVSVFFELRGFCSDTFDPITPALIDSLREYVCDVDCGIIYEMDKSFRAGAAKAKEYWEDK